MLSINTMLMLSNTKVPCAIFIIPPTERKRMELKDASCPKLTRHVRTLMTVRFGLLALVVSRPREQVTEARNHPS